MLKMGIFASKNATIKSEIPIFNKAHFYEKLNRQNWSLPDSLIFYLTKNPNKTEVYQKMTKSCKYFFAENPIICVSDLSYGNGRKWKTTCNKKPFELGNIKSKFWIKNKLEVRSYSSTPNFASTILQKIYKSEAKNFLFYNQIISFNDFIFLSSSVKKIYFNNVAVKNEEGLIVALEKLVAKCSKLKDFT